MRIHTNRFETLPLVSAVERERLARDSAAGRDHRDAAATVDALDGIEVAPAAARDDAPDPCRIVSWNAERGREPDAAARRLAPQQASAWLLTELDVGMARSRQLHTARSLADAWPRAGFAFAVEFLELGLGGAAERAAHAGASNEVGYHGAAILSPHALEAPALVRLDAGGDWWDGRRGERRVGGRIAVLATLRVGGTPVTLAAVHLESHAGPEHRDAQTAALIEALEAYAPDRPALIGGDVNTHALTERALEDPKELARLMREDPERFRLPRRHEPLFDRLAAAGFECDACNLVETSTQRTPEGRGGLHLDWFFSRGLAVSEPEVVAATDPESGAALSDHEAIAVTISPER